MGPRHWGHGKLMAACASRLGWSTTDWPSDYWLTAPKGESGSLSQIFQEYKPTLVQYIAIPVWLFYSSAFSVSWHPNVG